MKYKIIIFSLALIVFHNATCQTENRGTFTIKQSDTLFKVYIADKMGGTVTKEELLQAGKLDLPFNKGGQITGFTLDIHYEYRTPVACDTSAAPPSMKSTSATLTKEMRTAISKTYKSNGCYIVGFIFHNITCLSEKGKPVRGKDIHLLFM
jgi:hypothetical protein